MSAKFLRFMIAGLSGLMLVVLVANYNTASASYTVPSVGQTINVLDEENHTPTPTPTATPYGYGQCGLSGCGGGFQ